MVEFHVAECHMVEVPHDETTIPHHDIPHDGKWGHQVVVTLTGFIGSTTGFFLVPSPFRLLQLRWAGCNGPNMLPPALTGLIWSAVKDIE